MKNLLLIALLAIGAAEVVLADEMEVPKFSSPPAQYKSPYEDTLLVGDRTARSLLFWLNVSGANGHQCYLAGKAMSGNNQTYRYAEMASGCVLDIVLVEHSAVIIDSDNKCHESHCGSRAYFNGAVLRLQE